MKLFMILLFWAQTSFAAEASSDPSVKEIMHKIYATIQEIFPLSFNESEFKSEKNKEKVLTQLSQLETYAGSLHDHMKTQPIPAFVAQNLKRNAVEAKQSYARAQYEQASFVLQHMVENCMSCHERNPAIQTFVNNQDFSKFITSGSLPVSERAKFLIATRQFDDVLQVLESYFSTGVTDLNETFADGTMIMYLKTSLQVKENPKRVLNFLVKLQSQRQLSGFVDKIINAWIKDLRHEFQLPSSQESVTNLKKTLMETHKGSLFESPSASFAKWISIASKLHRTLRNEKLSPTEQSDIYYLLGYIENTLDHSYWLSETKFYLQTAIQVAPHTLSSKKAFLLLEELTVLGYTGSSGTHLPQDEVEWLSELRDQSSVIEKKSSKKKSSELGTRPKR